MNHGADLVHGQVAEPGFFRSLFSTYIEGTEFEVDEARDIVFQHKVHETRPKDAHDIVGTLQLIEHWAESRHVADSYDAFIGLRSRSSNEGRESLI